MVLTMVQFSTSKLEEYLRNPGQFIDDLATLEESQTGNSLYLDKSWEAIHYILTGKKIGGGTTAIEKTIYSEQFFDEEQDLGMGPASYLTADQVKQINLLLEKLDDNYLKEKYQPQEMTNIGIYPSFWDKNSDLFEYVSENFQQLKNFYRDAASKNNAVASYLGW